MEGVVRVVKDLPTRISTRNIAAVKVPNRVTEDYIAEHVEPIYRTKGSLSRNSDGQFIAVDLRVEMLNKKGCQNSDIEKSCYNAQEIAVFFRQIGFDKDTTVYVTESRWDSSLDSLKDLFPKTYTKVS